MIRSLEKAEINYVIVGGFAAILNGRPRTTTDIDVIIEKDISKLNKLIESLKIEDFDIMDSQISLALKDKSNLSIFDAHSPLHIDLKMAINKDKKEVLEQSVIQQYQVISIRVASLMQILYGKLLYLGDISDSAENEMLEYSDILDFINVYQKASEIDLPWLKLKAKQHNLENTLNRLLNYISNLEA
jgi:hypothetical protein